MVYMAICTSPQQLLKFVSVLLLDQNKIFNLIYYKEEVRILLYATTVMNTERIYFDICICKRPILYKYTYYISISRYYDSASYPLTKFGEKHYTVNPTTCIGVTDA